jgi:hypothetical protein
MKRLSWQLVIAALFAVLLLWNGETSVGAGDGPGEGETIAIQEMEKGNLLANGSMEEGFYWKYPNHFIANGWKRWWMNDDIPEYDDARAWRPHRYDGNHAQVYFRWGKPYTAGIYQTVAARPCTLYQFSIYGRNHSGLGLDHHARVGIDPLGRKYQLYMDSLPPEIVWSSEQTYFYVWGLHTVTAESHGDQITAITYVSPDQEYTVYDTFWDAASLVELPPPPGRLPDPIDWDPSETITDISTRMEPGQLTIQWQTTISASSQVWYRVDSPTLPITPTGTLLTPAASVYLPLILSCYENGPRYPMYTPIDQSDLTRHQTTITGLEKGQLVEFVILARHLVGDTCHTSASQVVEVVYFVKPLPPPPSPQDLTSETGDRHQSP